MVLLYSVVVSCCHRSLTTICSGAIHRSLLYSGGAWCHRKYNTIVMWCVVVERGAMCSAIPIYVVSGGAVWWCCVLVGKRSGCLLYMCCMYVMIHPRTVGLQWNCRNTVISNTSFVDALMGRKKKMRSGVESTLFNPYRKNVMALRKLQSFSATTQGQLRAATLYRDAEWEEFRVKFYRDGVYQTEADYHDTDKQSAIDTAKMFCIRIEPQTVVIEETGEEIYL